MATALALVQTDTFTIDELIARAVAVHGDNYKRHAPNKHRPFDVFYIGDVFGENTLVIELHQDKTFCHKPGGLTAVFPRIDFKTLYKKIVAHQKPKPCFTPRPQIDNGLVALHKLGRAFDYRDVMTTQNFAPAHAKLMLHMLKRQGKIRESWHIQQPQKYEVITAASPELFPVKVVEELPELDQWNAEWLRTLARLDREEG